MISNWAKTARGRHELSFLAVVFVSFLIVPMVVKELFPFSAATMFAFNCHRLTSYMVKDPEGRDLDPDLFGLQYGPNIFDPPVDTLGRHGYGRQSPPGLLRAGSCDEPVSDDEVSALVRERLAYFPDIDYVMVTQTVYGDKDGKSVGIIRQKTWRVDNLSRMEHKL